MGSQTVWPDSQPHIPTPRGSPFSHHQRSEWVHSPLYGDLRSNQLLQSSPWSTVEPAPVPVFVPSQPTLSAGMEPERRARLRGSHLQSLQTQLEQEAGTRAEEPGAQFGLRIFFLRSQTQFCVPFERRQRIAALGPMRPASFNLLVAAISNYNF